MALQKSVSLVEAAKRGKLKKYLNKYLDSCLSEKGADKKKAWQKFPNPAGFCRWLGCGTQEIDELKINDPASAGYLFAVMEDEALNIAISSPTVLCAYLKKRLGYAEKNETPPQAEADIMRIIFDHDIGEDGA